MDNFEFIRQRDQVLFGYKPQRRRKMKSLYKRINEGTKEIGKRILQHPGRVLAMLALLLGGCTGKVKSPFEVGGYVQKDEGVALVQKSSTYVFNGDTETENIDVTDEDGIYSIDLIVKNPSGSSTTYKLKEGSSSAPETYNTTKDINYNQNGTWKLITEVKDDIPNNPITKSTQERIVYLNANDIMQTVEANKLELVDFTSNWGPVDQSTIMDILTNSAGVYDMNGNKAMVHVKQYRRWDIRGPPGEADFGIEFNPKLNWDGITNFTSGSTNGIPYKKVGGIAPASKIFYIQQPVKTWNDIKAVILDLKANDFYTK